MISGERPFFTLRFLQLHIVSFHVDRHRCVFFSVNSIFCLATVFLELFYVYCYFYCLDLCCGTFRLNFIKVLNKIRFLCCDKYCEILDDACSFWLAFRYSVLIYSSNVNSLSMVIPNNFSLLSVTHPLMFIKVC